MAVSYAAIAPPAFAQSAPTGTQPVPGQKQPLRPIEQGVGDVNPLQTGERLVPQDLRQPTGWDRVYRLTGDANKNGGGGLFARIDGGIAAVFPWSTYSATARGKMPTVPPGTIYYIGGLPSSLTTAPAADQPDKSFNFLDRSARPASPERPNLHADNSLETSARPLLRGEKPGAQARETPPSLWTSETYRRDRLGELLKQASK